MLKKSAGRQAGKERNLDCQLCQFGAIPAHLDWCNHLLAAKAATTATFPPPPVFSRTTAVKPRREAHWSMMARYEVARSRTCLCGCVATCSSGRVDILWCWSGVGWEERGSMIRIRIASDKYKDRCLDMRDLAASKWRRRRRRHARVPSKQPESLHECPLDRLHLSVSQIDIQ